MIKSKKHFVLAIAIAPLLLSHLAHASDSHVAGGFEASGHIVTGAGFEHFSNDAVTEWTNDGTFPGVIGSYIPNVANAAAPNPGQNNFQFYVDTAELDITKSFGKNIRLRTDLEFGRIASGSFSNFNLEQAYATLNIPLGSGIEMLMGRFWSPCGLEAEDSYDNELISWSILSRANLYPLSLTGVKFYYSFSDLVSLHLFVANGFTNDTSIKVSDMPSIGMTLNFEWGDEEAKNNIALTPHFGAESGSNRHYTYAIDLDAGFYLTPKFVIKGQGIFRRDNGFGGPNAEYAAGLLILRYDFLDTLYGILKYSYANQFDASNGVLNLTGAEQQIHEMSIGGGYSLTDDAIIKFETRFDFIDPATGVGSNQWNLGAAMAFAYQF